MAKPLVLLCNPPSPPDGMADREFALGMGRVGTLSERAIPPHTLAWTAAALQHAGWQVVAVDAVASRLNNAQTISAILNHRPGVLILLVSPATAAADCEFIHALRLHVTSLPILLVGLGARHLPANLIREANMVLAGEPEGVADVACDFLLANKGRVGLVSPQALNVPAYDAVGRLVDLDSLPLPAWDLFPMRSYDRLPIVSSRGCNRGCRYCPVPVTQGTIFRALAAERVVEEMRLINSCYRVQRFQFLDPLWTADHEHAEALCNALIQSGLSRRIQWSCETRADLLDLFLLDRMAKAGCRELHLGLESVAPDALVALGRLASPQDAPEYLRRFQQVVRACRTLNIASHVHVIEGVPGDEGGTEAARTFLRTCPPDALHVTPLFLHPGTSLLPTSPLPFEQPEQEVLAGSLDQPPTKTSGWWRVVGRLRSLPSA
jgi:anaerobic magnesium-protoporphyrin IX monomethyl ester cyclase